MLYLDNALILQVQIRLHPFLEIFNRNEIHVLLLKHDYQFEQMNGGKAEILKQTKSFFFLF